VPYPGWSDKDVRQYKHILASSGSKSEAAATVNKGRTKRGTTKKQKKRKR
jgi:hypothetical protein